MVVPLNFSNAATTLSIKTTSAVICGVVCMALWYKMTARNQTSQTSSGLTMCSAVTQWIRSSSKPTLKASTSDPVGGLIPIGLVLKWKGNTSSCLQIVLYVSMHRACIEPLVYTIT